ncbi:hypothetical protein BLOT_012961 [Blomia tropicalis]|nr:hypothetical protein BLOT_012961 [Blomia tropicalis]
MGIGKSMLKIIAELNGEICPVVPNFSIQTILILNIIQATINTEKKSLYIDSQLYKKSSLNGTLYPVLHLMEPAV